MFKVLAASAALAAVCVTGASASTISFDDFAHSDNVTQVSTDDGLISADVSATGGINRAYAFDSTLSNTRDDDLEGPFHRFSDSSELLDPGRILIIQENNRSADDNARGGTLTFEFDQAVDFTGFTLLDDATVTITSSSVPSVFTASLPVPGADGFFELFETAGLFVGVRDLTFTLDGSGAIDGLQIAPVPVPAALPMLLLGLGGLGVASRRRKRA